MDLKATSRLHGIAGQNHFPMSGKQIPADICFGTLHGAAM